MNVVQRIGSLLLPVVHLAASVMAFGAYPLFVYSAMRDSWPGVVAASVGLLFSLKVIRLSLSLRASREQAKTGPSVGTAQPKNRRAAAPLN